MIIGTQILARELPSLLEGKARERIFIVVEAQVAELHPDLLALLLEVLPQAVIRTLRGGESCKTTESLGLSGLGSVKKGQHVVVPSSSLEGELFWT